MIYHYTDPGLLVQHSPDLDLRIQPARMERPIYVGTLLNHRECHELIAAMEAKIAAGDSWNSRVYDYGQATGSAVASSRVSIQIRPTGPLFDDAFAMMDNVVKTVAPHVFTGFEGDYDLRRFDDQGLIYREGGVFRRHADDSIVRSGKWFYNQPRRQLTAILYLSEQVTFVDGGNQFAGGTLSFPNIRDQYEQPLQIIPRAGMLILFPSHPQFVHHVDYIVDGERHAITRWYTVQPDAALKRPSVPIPRMPSAPNLPEA